MIHAYNGLGLVNPEAHFSSFILQHDFLFQKDEKVIRKLGNFLGKI